MSAIKTTQALISGETLKFYLKIAVRRKVFYQIRKTRETLIPIIRL